MFHKIIREHFKIIAHNYLAGRCTKTDFKCAIGYLGLLQERLVNHYKRLLERN